MRRFFHRFHSLGLAGKLVLAPDRTHSDRAACSTFRFITVTWSCKQSKHRPFHSYTMKQAIQEDFILDVLRYYTPVESYYKLIKKIEDDPEFDTKRARKKLRRYVESHEHAIRLKAEIIVDHFHEQVLALNKIGGKARAMVVTGGILARGPVLPRDPAVPPGAQEPVSGHRRLFRRARAWRGEGQ